VRALALAENAGPQAPGATVSRDPHASPASRAATVTEPTCAYCGHRLRLVEILLHRVSFRDSG